MRGVHKKFDKTLHSGHDPKSRKVVKEYFAKSGLVVTDNPNRYGVDLISEDGTLQIELEHRPPWDGENFPFSDVNVPERKAKFLKDGNVQYIILNKDYSRLGIISGKDIKEFIIDETLEMNRNKFVKHNEYFFKVPVGKFKWVKI